MKVFGIILLALIIFAHPSRAAAADAVIVLPFENSSGQPENNWIGESFSIALTDQFGSFGLAAISSDERNDAYERLGLPPSTILTRAAAIKIGEKAGANLIVVGTFKIIGEGKSRTVSITARVIDAREGRSIGNDYIFSSPINELQSMQAKLAWEILYIRNPSFPFSRDQFVGKNVAVPSSAFESYIKSLTATAKEERVKLLFRAISEYQKERPGQYAQAIFCLGKLYYDDKNHKDSIKWFEKIGEKEPAYFESQFYLGAAYLLSGDVDKAQTLLKQLAGRAPLYEVLNNAAVAAIKKGSLEEAARLIGLAVQAAPNDDDVLFNYGYTLWRAGQYAGAANQLNKLARRQTKDGQIFYLLAKSLAQMNQNSEAAAALNEAKRYLPEFAKWETSGKVPPLERVKERFNRVAYQRLTLQNDSNSSAASAQAKQIETLKAKAQTLFSAGRDGEAAAALTELLRLAPDNADAHLLIGRIYERRGDGVSAMNSLKAAVFWNPKLVAAHVLLGRLYIQQNNRTQAAAHLKLALAADPQDRDALALERLLGAAADKK